jgi:CRISPR-associated endonuclease/helicase Cas3
MRRSDNETIGISAELFARSPKRERGIPSQLYAKHIGGVCKRVMEHANGVAPYHRMGAFLATVCSWASEFHDLGKLDSDNQKVLSGAKKARTLPWHHWDAGVAHLLTQEKQAADLAALLIYAHHTGLPDLSKEETRGLCYLRDDDDELIARTNHDLGRCLTLHRQVVGMPRYPDTCTEFAHRAQIALFLRIALSCLVDADHGDSAQHEGQYCDEMPYELHPTRRLEALERYVKKLKQDVKQPSERELERSRIRDDMFQRCRDAAGNASIYCCDSPVGTGKTTAVMAHLLRAAQAKKLRRIFIVLPYSNIITQSVNTYREALTFEGEDPKKVIVEHHHRAEFGDGENGEYMRQLTTLWQAPIIITTAVQFFETLASARPASLRKLHALPGSAIFLDESHAALPAKLWPQAWQWLNGYIRDWGCHLVMASGSLNRFWKIAEFDSTQPTVPELLDEDFRSTLQGQEAQRVTYRLKDEALDSDDLCKWLAQLPGPRLLIVNTVQSAAAIAQSMNERYGRAKVEHLSTALMPSDREQTLQTVIARLDNKEDIDWTLVATSCVEAGVNLSFRTGVREAASLVSLLQTAGRVNRHNQYSQADVWTIRLSHTGLLKAHPAFAESSTVLLQLFERGSVNPSSCTHALREELLRAGQFRENISRAEEALNFKEVAQKFRVIDAETVTVIVGEALKKRIACYEHIQHAELQRASVQIWTNRLENLRLEENARYPGLYVWPYEYTKFLGYMAGLLPLEHLKLKGMAIL